MARRDRPTLLTPTFILLTLVNFFYFLAIGIIIPTIPLYLEGPLGAGKIAIGTAIGSFAATALFLRPWTGRLADRVGRRGPIQAGIGLATVTTIGLIPSHSLAPIFGLRLVSGVAEALFFVAASAAINDLAPDERRGEAVSLFSLALYGGLAVGPLVGEGVLHAVGFTEVWIASAASGGVALLLATRIPETRPAGLSAPGPQRLLHPAALRPGSALLVSIWGFAGFNTFIPLYVKQVGLDGSRYVFLLFSSLVFLIRSVGASIPDRIGAARSARIAVVLSSIGLLMIGGLRSAAGLYAGTAVYSIGIALSFPALMSLAVSGAAPHERGAVVGTFTAFLDLGFGIGPITLGVVADHFDYGGAFLAGGAIAAMGLLMLAGLGRRAAPSAAEA